MSLPIALERVLYQYLNRQLNGSLVIVAVLISSVSISLAGGCGLGSLRGS